MHFTQSRLDWVLANFYPNLTKIFKNMAVVHFSRAFFCGKRMSFYFCPEFCNFLLSFVPILIFWLLNEKFLKEINLKKFENFEEKKSNFCPLFYWNLKFIFSPVSQWEIFCLGIPSLRHLNNMLVGFGMPMPAGQNYWW